jgi:hypothetical protein
LWGQSLPGKIRITNTNIEVVFMGLEDLNEKLYGRDVHLGRAEQHTVFDPEQGTIADPNVKVQFQKKETWIAPIEKKTSSVEPGIVFADITTHRRRRRIALFLGGLALILLVGGIVFKARGMLFNEERVLVSISGPKDVASVEEITFTVTYTNNNWSGLKNASLILSYPDTFHVQAESSMKVNGSLAEITVGDIAAHADGKIFLKGKFYGSKSDRMNIQATLHYTPDKVSTVLEKTAQIIVTVASSPLSLEITAPIELATGQDVEYVIDYSNKSDVQFSNLRVKMEYPEGFRLVSSEPKPSEGDSVWYVGNFNSNDAGRITIRGVLSGVGGEYKSVHGMIGFFQGDGNFVSYGENIRQTHIISSPLSISQTVNQLTDISVKPGDSLTYAIHYRNDGNIGIRDAIVTVEIDPTFLDVNRLSLQKGGYDAARKVIIWKASDISNLGKLEPGGEGEISFNVPVIDKIPTGSGKNLSIRTVAKIDSLDIPTPIGANKIIASNTLLVKLQSTADITSHVLYTDTVFPNTGPIPPKVGQETSYTVYLDVTNSLNDLKQARVTAMLPTGVQYSGKYSPSEEVVTFNERSGDFVWELGSFSGSEKKRRILAFQVSVIPSPNQVGDLLTLVSNIVFTGKDAYTNQDIRADKEKQLNTIENDSVYGSSNGSSPVQKAD